MKHFFTSTHILELLFCIIFIQSCAKIATQLVKDSECSVEISGMSCIPSGEFIRGSNKHEPNEKPESSIFLNAYYIDKFEVTNKDLKKCLDAGSCRQCLTTGKCKKIHPNYGARYSQDLQPAVGVSWYTAQEYCQFLGKRLPTEAEWEKASRGNEGDNFPWGNETASCEKAIIEEDGRKGCWDKKLSPPHYMTTRKVGTRPAYRFGLYDMAGNSWEWVSDWYSTSYAECGKDCMQSNPHGACPGQSSCERFGSRKIVRGGAWWWPNDYARGSRRRPHVPGNFPEYHHFGFRCAKSH